MKILGYRFLGFLMLLSVIGLVVGSSINYASAGSQSVEECLKKCNSNFTTCLEIWTPVCEWIFTSDAEFEVCFNEVANECEEQAVKCTDRCVPQPPCGPVESLC